MKQTIVKPLVPHRLRRSSLPACQALSAWLDLNASETDRYVGRPLRSTGRKSRRQTPSFQTGAFARDGATGKLSDEWDVGPIQLGRSFANFFVAALIAAPGVSRTFLIWVRHRASSPIRGEGANPTRHRCIAAGNC